MSLVRNGTAIKYVYPYKKDRAPRPYTTQTEVFEESNAYGLGSMSGDTLLFEYTLGGTGTTTTCGRRRLFGGFGRRRRRRQSVCTSIPGFALYIRNFSATLGHVDCSGMYCSSTSGGAVNKCTARPTTLCQDTTGFAANNAAVDCLRGSAVCTSVTGKFCIAERNTCYTGKLPEKPKEALVFVDGSNELQIKIQPSDQASSISVTHYNVNRYIAQETTRTSWEASELACASLGTCHLVSIHSQQENEIVKNIISLSYSNYYWFGLVRN